MSGRVFRVSSLPPEAADAATPLLDGAAPGSVQALVAERAALERRIARLQEAEQRQARKRRELAIERVRSLMAMWSITLPELRRALREDEPARAPLPAGQRFKYVHPVTGEAWDGSGEHPPWLRQALLQQGYTVTELVQAARALEARLDAEARQAQA